MRAAASRDRLIRSSSPFEVWPERLPRLGGDTAKRSVDISISLLLIPLFLSLCVLLTLTNPFLNRGPLFFVQDRVGRGGRSFRLLKFRTMLPPAQARPAAFAPDERDRLTPLGGLLRRHRLDEVPQIINVLGGTMSLVGPRPEQVPFAARFAREIEGFDLRHAVRPGISGLAQITLGYAGSDGEVRARLAHDLAYVELRSLALDLHILARTVIVVVRGREGC